MSFNCWILDIIRLQYRSLVWILFTMACAHHKEKIHDPSTHYDSDSSLADNDEPTNNSLPLPCNKRHHHTLNFIHNNIHEDSVDTVGECAPEPLSQREGPQAPNPRTTVCKGEKPSPGYKSVCQQQTCEGRGFKTYDAGDKTWKCRIAHSGLCWVCFNAPTCPVCGDTKKRL